MKKKLALACCVSVLSASLAFAQTFNSPVDDDARATIPSSGLTVTGTQTVADVGDCTRVDINITGDVTGTNDLDSGSDLVRFSLWDDGTEKDFEVVSIPVGDTVTVDVDLGFEGLFETGAAGVGVLVYDGPSTSDVLLFVDDPFIPEDVVGSCGGEQPEFVPVPVNSPWALALLLIALFAVGLGMTRRLRSN